MKNLRLFPWLCLWYTIKLYESRQTGGKSFVFHDKMQTNKADT